VGRYAALPIVDGTAVEEKEREKALQLENRNALTKRILVYRIVKLLSSPESKVRKNNLSSHFFRSLKDLPCH
jgi:hypothetical protein